MRTERQHAMEQSALFKRYVTKVEAVPDDPAPDADDAAAAAVPGLDTGAAVGSAEALTADAVAAEVMQLFQNARGMSFSVLVASRIQELRGRHEFPGSDDE